MKLRSRASPYSREEPWRPGEPALDSFPKSAGDVPAALGWLACAFGFTEEMRHATPGGMHAAMTLDGQRIMMGQGSKEWRMLSAHETEAATQGIFVYLADVDAHYERARVAGAEIVHPPRDESYGRTYTARDLDGHPWFFTTPPSER
jgi:PhnB protein